MPTALEGYVNISPNGLEKLNEDYRNLLESGIDFDIPLIVSNAGGMTIKSDDGEKGAYKDAVKGVFCNGNILAVFVCAKYDGGKIELYRKPEESDFERIFPMFNANKVVRKLKEEISKYGR